MSPYPASLFKVLVAYHVMTMVDDHQLSLNDPYTYSSGATMETRSIRDWMEPMMTYSDNLSAQALLQMMHQRNQVDAMNAEFRDLGLGTLQINGTDPATGGNWQPGMIHMTALDTARLFWLIDGAPRDYVLWKRPDRDPVTAAELSDSSRAYLKDLLGQQGYNEALSVANFATYQRGDKVFGAANTRPGIPSRVPKRWIDSADGTVTVDGVPYGQDVRYYNDRVAEVNFAHKTGLTYNYGSDAGIVQSLPDKPYRHYIIAYLSNLGYRYTDAVFADRKNYPLYDSVGGIAYTQRIPALGKAIDDGLSQGSYS
jgi:beta-lactamase class A